MTLCHTGAEFDDFFMQQWQLHYFGTVFANKPAKERFFSFII